MALCHKRTNRRKNYASPAVSDKSETEDKDESDESNKERNICTVSQSCMKRASDRKSLLKCVTVEAYNSLNPKKRKEVTAFLDDGSEKSYISKKLANQLNLTKVDEVKFDLSGFGGKKLGEYKSSVFELGLKGKEIDILIKAREIEKVMPKLPMIQYSHQIRSKLFRNKIQLPTVHEEPQILIGNDFYNQLAISPIEQLPNGFWISQSKLGKIISGEGKISQNPEQKSADKIVGAASVSQTIEFDELVKGTEEWKEEFELNKMVDRHNKLETIGLGDADDDENEKWLKDFQEKLDFNGERYEVRFSWTEEADKLPSNYYLALGRLKSLRKKYISEKPEVFKQCQEIIQEQLKKGMIEKAPITKGERVHYLPHHVVERPDKQFTKYRMVFDASSKTNKNVPSLNEAINKGPKLYNDLTGILLRARLKKYLITSDVEKAFLQISIHPDDRDVLRFLWYEIPEKPDSPLIEYRFCRVTFGVICSPAHLSLVLAHHYKKYDHPISKQLEQDTYVDNLLLGVSDQTEIKEVYEFMKRVFIEAGMNVREFTSNAWEEIAKLPEKDRNDSSDTKLLGLNWNVKNDQLAIKIPEFPSDKKVTRRTILAQIAKPFDPMGIISPIILKAKLIRRKVEADKSLKWDSPVDPSIEQEWRNEMEKWKNQTIEVPRTYADLNKNQNTEFELHGFSDASKEGLGCAIYLRTKNGEKIWTQLAFAKSLVVPSQL